MNEDIDKIAVAVEYAHGFDPEIPVEVPDIIGVSEESVRAISARRAERPEVLDFRLEALAAWQEMHEPHWAGFNYETIDYRKLQFFAEPEKNEAADEKIRAAYERLGVPLEEREILSGVAVDAVVDSKSVATTYKKQLAELGIIFCPMSEALAKHFDLVREHFASVVPARDNFFAALNSAVFTDGTFIYIPAGVKCPIELSSYFRLQAAKVGQFERTLIIVGEGAELTYLEGCSAPIRDAYQLHSGVVEVVAKEGARINYATIQNWYGGDDEGRGGVLNFTTKRAVLDKGAAVSWTQLEVGAVRTWKYPACVMLGEGAKGEFYSVAITTRAQAADTGAKMLHLAPHTTSLVRSKSVAMGRSTNTYRGLIRIGADAVGARSFSKCDNLVVGESARAESLPVLEGHIGDAEVAHEASVSSISAAQLFALACLGLGEEEAVGLVVNGFALDVVRRLPAEFAMEARELINLKIEE